MAMLGVITLSSTAYAGGSQNDVVRLSGTTPFPSQCDGQPPTGTLYTNAEVQPHIAVDPADPRHLVGVWQQDRWSGVGAQGLVTATSFDGGAKWSRATPAVARCEGGDYWRATDSQVSIGLDGTAYVVSLSMNTAVAQGDHAILVSRSNNGGLSWQTPATLAHEGADPANYIWNDLPSVTADPTDPRYAYVVWDRIVEPPLGGPIYLARSADRGSSWQAARPIYDPGANAAAEGVKIVVRPDGTLIAFFLLLQVDPATQNSAYSFQVVRSTDKGSTWSAPTKIADAAAVGTKDPVTGTNLRDGSNVEGQIAVGPDGSLHAVWQDSRFANGTRDGIALSNSTDGGRTWSTPTSVTSDPSTQAFSPAVAVNSDGTIGVTYSTLTATGADYRISQSVDCGQTWTTSQLAGSFSLATAPKVASGALYLGDYHGMAAAGSRFVSVFAKTNDGRPDNLTDIFATFSRGRI